MMESKKKAFSLYDIVMIGLMAAVVFVVTMFLSIRIPTPTGTTMIKLANAFVLLCGLLLGPVRGGLAAGIGSMIFDLMTPEYAPEAWITFLRFFLMAWLCGVIAYAVPLPQRSLRATSWRALQVRCSRRCCTCSRVLLS